MPGEPKSPCLLGRHHAAPASGCAARLTNQDVERTTVHFRPFGPGRRVHLTEDMTSPHFQFGQTKRVGPLCPRLGPGRRKPHAIRSNERSRNTWRKSSTSFEARASGTP
jgi:hypothetical protein